MRTTATLTEVCVEGIKDESGSSNELAMKQTDLERNAVYQRYRSNAIETMKTQVIEAAQDVFQKALQIDANNR